MAKELTFGYSPCPNDTFMLNAIAHAVVGVDGFKIPPVLRDVETLPRSVSSPPTIGSLTS